MKKFKLIGNVLFWFTLISPLVAFTMASLIGEVEIFGIGGIIRYSWIMWLFIPFGILSVLIGIYLKKGSHKYKKNFIIAIICIPILIVFGSFKFIYGNVFSYDTDKVSVIEEMTNLELPNKVKIVTNKSDTYNESFLKIVDEEDRTNFESELERNPLWQTELSSKIKSILPLLTQTEVEKFDYFVFYNLTNKEYNIYPSDGESKCIFIAYNTQKHRLIILDDFVVNLD